MLALGCDFVPPSDPSLAISRLKAAVLECAESLSRLKSEVASSSVIRRGPYTMVPNSEWSTSLIERIERTGSSAKKVPARVEHTPLFAFPLTSNVNSGIAGGIQKSENGRRVPKDCRSRRIARTAPSLRERGTSRRRAFDPLPRRSKQTLVLMLRPRMNLGSLSLNGALSISLNCDRMNLLTESYTLPLPLFIGFSSLIRIPSSCV